MTTMAILRDFFSAGGCGAVVAAAAGFSPLGACVGAGAGVGVAHALNTRLTNKTITASFIQLPEVPGLTIEPTHPAVLKLIHQTIEAGHRHGLWVGVCGEMGADPLMTPLLLGMGIDELSVAPLAVPLVKDVVRSLKYSRARELADVALSCKSAVEVLSHCRKLTMEVAPELLELI